MDIYSKIDAIFSEEAEEKPKWAREILNELKEIKTLLEEHKQHKAPATQSRQNNLYKFIKEFRTAMRADTIEGVYPTFEYQNQKLGVDFKGLLYNKKTSHILGRDEAFRVYKYAYNLHKHDENIA